MEHHILMRNSESSLHHWTAEDTTLIRCPEFEVKFGNFLLGHLRARHVILLRAFFNQKPRFRKLKRRSDLIAVTQSSGQSRMKSGWMIRFGSINHSTNARAERSRVHDPFNAVGLMFARDTSGARDDLVVSLITIGQPDRRATS
jgi:hypothetical protein